MVLLTRVLGRCEDVAQYSRISRGVLSPHSQSENEELLKNLFKWEHFSPLEYLDFTFYVQSSIVAARQLFRHRIGVSPLEQSLRYVTLDDIKFVYPTKDQETVEAMDKAYLYASQAYQSLINKGVEPEHARYVLPLGTATQYYLHLNGRSFLELYQKRSTDEVQPETRELVQEMMEQLVSRNETNLYARCVKEYCGQ